MEFIDLTSASEDERYQVKGILSNVSRNLEFTCGNKLNKVTKSSIKDRHTDQTNINNNYYNNKSSNHQSSNTFNQTSNQSDQSTSNNTSNNSNSKKMNGYHYNYSNNYPNNNMDSDHPNSSHNHQYNHHYNHHYHSNNHPPYWPDHQTAQYHKMPYYTPSPPHQFTSKPFYTYRMAQPNLQTNLAANSISPIMLTPAEYTNDSNNSNYGQQHRTNTSNHLTHEQQIPPHHHLSRQSIVYSNGVQSNHHSFMHHHAAPFIPNAQPNLPMYFVPLHHHPMTQFYPVNHMATTQPTAILTPAISPQQLDDTTITTTSTTTASLMNQNDFDNMTTTDDGELIDECKAESEHSSDINVHEEEEDNEKVNKDQSMISNYSFMSPESLGEDVEESSSKNDDEINLNADSNENDDQQAELDDKLVNENEEKEPSSDLPEETTTTNSTDNVAVVQCNYEEIIIIEDQVNGLKIEENESNIGQDVKEVKPNENSINENNGTTEQIENNSDQADDTNETENITSSSSSKGDEKPRSWADLFKSNNMNFSKPSKILIDDSSNTSNNLFNTTDFEPLGHQIDSIVKLTTRNPQQQTIKSVPVEEDAMFPKLSKKLKELNLKHSLPLLVPRGFTNRSNWCYINSILQALLYCPPFYNLMREIAEISGIFREKSATPIIDSFAKFFTNFMPNEQLMRRVKNSSQFSYDDLPKLDVYEPTCIYNVLGNINNECLKGRQEDAEEFLCAVLNCLHEEMLLLLNYDPKAPAVQHKQRSKNNSPSAGQLSSTDEKLSNQDNNNSKLVWKEVKTKHTKALNSSNSKNAESQITDIFGGTMLFVRRAGTDVLHSRQPFFTLKLDIQSDKIHTVEDALRNLTLSESIQGYQCPKTNKAIEASYQTFLDQLPAILVLHLKLHNDDNGQMKKSMKKINFPIDLEIPKECLAQQDRSKYSKTYKLLAVVHHDGKGTSQGHYFTDIYHIGTSLWLRCDDSKVESISVQQLMHPKDSKIPYLLFYRRFDTIFTNDRKMH